MKNDKGNIQYSFYDMDGINEIFDEKEFQSSKYVYCYDNNVKEKLLYSYQQKASKAFLPNDSFQGIELTNNDNLRISGGKLGETPQIAVISGAINPKTKNYSCSWVSTATVSNTKNFSGDNLEIEGLQISGSYTNCVIKDIGYDLNDGLFRVYKILSSDFSSNNY